MAFDASPDDITDSRSRLQREFTRIGVVSGYLLFVHASLRALGSVPGGAETIITALLAALGQEGTLLLPALSYAQYPRHIHDTRTTPANIGALPEYFRTRAGTVRSLHPTHSICGVGPRVAELFAHHALDRTPCGAHSPLNLMIDQQAKILMLGCGLRPNTTMHALEEYVRPPYVFGGECQYTMTDYQGRTFQQYYATHGFHGWEQRYDRLALLPNHDMLREDTVLAAPVWLIDTRKMREAVLDKLHDDPCFFVDHTTTDGQ